MCSTIDKAHKLWYILVAKLDDEHFDIVNESEIRTTYINYFAKHNECIKRDKNDMLIVEMCFKDVSTLWPIITSKLKRKFTISAMNIYCEVICKGNMSDAVEFVINELDEHKDEYSHYIIINQPHL